MPNQSRFGSRAAAFVLLITKLPRVGIRTAEEPSTSQLVTVNTRVHYKYWHLQLPMLPIHLRPQQRNHSKYY